MHNIHSKYNLQLKSTTSVVSQSLEALLKQICTEVGSFATIYWIKKASELATENLWCNWSNLKRNLWCLHPIHNTLPFNTQDAEDQGKIDVYLNFNYKCELQDQMNW